MKNNLVQMRISLAVTICCLALVVTVCSQASQAGTSTAAIITACSDGRVFFEGRCNPVQDLQALISADIEAMLTKGPAGRARSEQEVKQAIGPLFERYMTGAVTYEIHSLFGGEISRQIAELSSAGLRLLLDVRYYHDHYNKTVFAEISEGWRDNVISYIEGKTDLVIAVYKDSKQLNRELISDAFYQAIDMYGRDATGRITDKRFPEKYKELWMAIRQEGL